MTTDRAPRSRPEDARPATEPEASTVDAAHRGDGEGAPGGVTRGLTAHAWSPRGSRRLGSVAEVRDAFAEPDTRLWIDLEDPDAATLTELAACLGLHPLIVEDIVEKNQRAKVEVTGSTVQLVMFPLLYDGGLTTVEVDLVLAERFLLSAHPPEWQPSRSPHLRRGVEPFLAGGPDYLLWAVVDWLVDGYFPVFDKIDDELDELQDDVLSRPNDWLVERLFQVRRDLLTIRRAIVPQREIFNQLTNRHLALVKPERVLYFRDVYDHLIRLTEELDTFRELAASTLDAYLSTVNNRLSEVMKRLTAVTAILAGVGAVAGIFGMSEAGLAFEFQEALGFWVIAGATLGLGLLGFVYFRRIGWL